MDEVRNQQTNLAVAFYDYHKAYGMVRHDWMRRVYQWMGVPQKVVNVIVVLSNGSTVDSLYLELARDQQICSR